MDDDNDDAFLYGDGPSELDTSTVAQPSSTEISGKGVSTNSSSNINQQDTNDNVVNDEEEEEEDSDDDVSLSLYLSAAD